MRRALRHGSVGQYWIQAAIAAEHTAPQAAGAKNWQAIVALYDKLLDQTGQSPVVQLNRALAVAEVDGPHAGLALLANLDDRLGSYPLLAAARAELHRRADDLEVAALEYDKAIALTLPARKQESLRKAQAEIGGSRPSNVAGS